MFSNLRAIGASLLFVVLVATAFPTEAAYWPSSISSYTITDAIRDTRSSPFSDGWKHRFDSRGAIVEKNPVFDATATRNSKDTNVGVLVASTEDFLEKCFEVPGEVVRLNFADDSATPAKISDLVRTMSDERSRYAEKYAERFQAAYAKGGAAELKRQGLTDANGREKLTACDIDPNANSWFRLGSTGGDMPRATTPPNYGATTNPVYPQDNPLLRLGELDNKELKNVVERLSASVETQVDAMKKDQATAKLKEIDAANAAVSSGGTSNFTTAPTAAAGCQFGLGSSGAGVSTVQDLLIQYNLLDPLLRTGYYGSATESAVKQLEAQTGVKLNVGTQTASAGQCFDSTSFIKAITEASARETASGGTGSSGTRPGVGTSAGGGAGVASGGSGSTGAGSSTWPVCSDCTRGDLYLSYYDKDGVYHSGVAYDAMRDGDRSNEVKIPGTPFAWRKCEGRLSDIDICGLRVYDPDGIALTVVGLDPLIILQTLERFGIDIDELNEVADFLDANGVEYMPYELYAAGDGGLDLRDLAGGGLGTAYDWRFDVNCAAKGPYACAATEAAREYAEERGIVADPDVTDGPTIESIREGQRGLYCIEPEDQLEADIYREIYGPGGYRRADIEDPGAPECAWLNEPMGTPVGT